MFVVVMIRPISSPCIHISPHTNWVPLLGVNEHDFIIVMLQTNRFGTTARPKKVVPSMVVSRS
jgi:hypothetical protein